jgi:hypothetical protein
MSTSSLYNSTANLARKHSRVSLLAAGAAAAGMLGVAGVTASAPWAQAMDNVAKTAHATSQTSSNRSTSALDEVLGVQAHKAQPAHPQLTAVSKPAKAAVVAKPAAAVKPAAATKPAATKPAVATKPAAPAHAVLARSEAAQHPAVQHKAARPQANPGPTKPYLVYDSVTPGTLPANQPAAVYADGAYAASSSQVAGHHSVLWIDANGSDPNANVLDVEPGDATPAGAAVWINSHLRSQPHSEAIIYTMRSDWSAVQDSVGSLPSWMQSHVKYWIADPTGVPHVVPGSSATQWYWGSSYDISTANPNFEQ